MPEHNTELPSVDVKSRSVFKNAFRATTGDGLPSSHHPLLPFAISSSVFMASCVINSLKNFGTEKSSA